MNVQIPNLDVIEKDRTDSLHLNEAIKDIPLKSEEWQTTRQAFERLTREHTPDLIAYARELREMVQEQAKERHRWGGHDPSDGLRGSNNAEASFASCQHPLCEGARALLGELSE